MGGMDRRVFLTNPERKKEKNPSNNPEEGQAFFVSNGAFDQPKKAEVEAAWFGFLESPAVIDDVCHKTHDDPFAK